MHYWIILNLLFSLKWENDMIRLGKIYNECETGKDGIIFI